MKKMKKFLALLIALAMVLGMSTIGFAQTIGTVTTGTGSITVTNAAKGVDYKVYKLFDASVTGTADGSIAYSGTIPDELNAYFWQDEAGNIFAGTTETNEETGETTHTEITEISEEMEAALKAWAGGNTATAATPEGGADGSELKFAGLPYGYYVITTNQGEAAISVDSTNPDVEVVDKNSTTSISDAKKYANEEAAEDAEDTDNNVNIGDKVTYTISFGTSSYDGEGEDAMQITSYIISDDFASGVLTDVKVTSVTIGETAYTVGNPAAAPQFDTDGKITIPWVDNAKKSLYANGAEIVITYEATVADTAVIDGEGNTNKATITYTVDGDEGNPSQETVEDTIYTFAIAIKKVDQNGKALDGAVFEFPFYVKENADDDGAYIYAGTTAGNGLTNSLTTPENGLIIVKGVKDGSYQITETNPPKGYNKLTGPVTVEAQKTGKTTTSTTTYLDKDGNVVDKDEEYETEVLIEIETLSATSTVAVNKSGSTLPATGGIGTTIFYIVGGMLVIGAGVVLITRRRMDVQ